MVIKTVKNSRLYNLPVYDGLRYHYFFYLSMEMSLMLIGYARVSTADQCSSMQEDVLKSAGCEEIFMMFGEVEAKTARPGLHSALSHLRKGDMLVVWRLDRLGRSLAHLIQTIKELSEKGIGFKSLQESIDTTTSGGQLIFHIFGALAQFERELIRERTQAGL